MTQSEIEAAIAGLETALNSGVLEVAVGPDNTTTRFRSSAEIQQRLATLKDSLATLTGTGTRARTLRYSMSSGLL